MPHRRTPASPPPPSPPPREDFRRRYDDIETRRAELIARLHKLSDAAQSHPGHKRALKLLNDTFRRTKLAQRLSVLQAAAWLIDILERLTMTL